jgi:hypothetical protein
MLVPATLVACFSTSSQQPSRARTRATLGGTCMPAPTKPRSAAVSKTLILPNPCFANAKAHPSPPMPVMYVRFESDGSGLVEHISYLRQRWQYEGLQALPFLLGFRNGAFAQIRDHRLRSHDLAGFRSMESFPGRYLCYRRHGRQVPSGMPREYCGEG